MATDTALRITCSKAELASALGVVARAVSTRGAVQVLGGILLRVDEGTADARRNRHGDLATVVALR